MVKNQPASAEDTGSIPNLGRPHVPKQRSPHTTTTESACCRHWSLSARTYAWQQGSARTATKSSPALQLEKACAKAVKRNQQMNLRVFCGLPWWLGWQRIHLQCGRTGFDPWVRKILWRRAWQPTPVFLPGQCPWTEEPGGLHPWVRRESDTTERLSTGLPVEGCKAFQPVPLSS